MIKSRIIRRAELIAQTGDMRNAYKILTGNLEEERQLRRQRRKNYNIVKIELREINFEDFVLDLL
jgi:hypothetical protein